MVTPSLFFTNIEKKGNGLSQNSKVSLRGKQRYILLFPPKQSINFEPKTQKKNLSRLTPLFLLFPLPSFSTFHYP
jgi:hypothetical protein